MQIINKRNKNINIFLFLTIFIMILSQTGIEFFRKLMYLMYFLLFVFIFFKNKLKIFTTKFMNFYVVTSGMLIFYVGTIYLFNSSYKLQIIDVFVISMFMYILGVQISNINIKTNLLKTMLFAYVSGAVVLAIYIRINFFTTLSSWLGATENIYSKKNSAGQILSLALIILIFYFSELKGKIAKITRIISTCILIYVLILIQSRAVIVSLIGVVGFYLLLIRKDKVKILFLLCCILIVLVNNDYTWSIIEKLFYFNKYKGASLNEFSSNRLEWYYVAIIRWKENALFGIGLSYVDNLFINVLTSAGILGFLIIIPLWIWRIILNIKIYIKGRTIINKISIIVILLTIFMIIESMLEGFPPFGPGVCSFVFWMICGYWEGTQNKNLE